MFSITHDKNKKLSDLENSDESIDSNNLNINNNKAYFNCNNCNFNTEIEPNTLILSRSSIDNNNANIINVNKKKYLNMKYDRTLPRTRNYTCPNKKCESQKDYSKKEAVWFKINKNKFDLTYICLTCDEIW
jgi:general stress protein 26